MGRKNSRILGVIPARGGSKGIPKKNLYPLNGKPLIDYTIEAALDSDLDDVIVSTDDKEILNHCINRVNIADRPKSLAEDKTPMMPVIKHAIMSYIALKGRGAGSVMLLQPTSPFRITEDINESIKIFNKKDYLTNKTCDSLVSVYEGIHPIKSYECQEGAIPEPFYLKQPPYDKRKHRCLTRNGAIFILENSLINEGRLIGDDLGFYLMPKHRSIDIDSYEDILMAEAVLRYGEGDHESTPDGLRRSWEGCLQGIKTTP